MANKLETDYVFGIDKDIQQKLAAKLDPEKQAQAQAWIEAVTGQAFPGSFHESLKDGTRLCQLVNAIKPGTVGKIKDSKMPFVQRENIVNYLNGCKALGMKETDCFVTQDLFEGDNLVAVTDQLFALGALSRNVEGFSGPYLGVKFADENKREFTEEQLAAGRAIVPQQLAGSVAVEKSKGTDAIVMYGKVGQEMGKASSVASQQTAGSIAVEKSKGTDAIVMYGKVGQELGKASSAATQQTAGSIAVEKDKGTDAIVKYGKVGQELGVASSAPTQQTAGSIAIEKDKGTDAIVKYGKVGQELGKASAAPTQQTAGSIAVEKDKGTDAIVKYGKVGQELGKASAEPTQQNQGSIQMDRQAKLDNITRGLN